VAGDRGHQSRLLDPCWTEITISKPWESVARNGPGISTTCVVANPDAGSMAFGFRPERQISHNVKARRASHPRGLHYLARPTGFEPVAFGFVEDIHVSSNTCRDVQACANTGSVSDEKSKNVQIHASLRKDFAGSLLDGVATDDEALRSVGKLLTVRQVAKVLGVCPATVYGLCDRGELPHYRVRNAIRVDVMEIKAMLQRSRGKHPR
jgi:excisionase family DNA binding protein